MTVLETEDEHNPVFTLLQEYKWNEALKAAKKSPKFARDLYMLTGFFDAQISSRVSALHLALMLRAPQEVIEGLVKIHPEGVQLCESKYKRAPIHIAVLNGSPATIVNLLLKIDPRSAQRKDKNGRIALHYACRDEIHGESSTRALLKAFNEGAMVSDDGGFLPLHVACRSGASINVVRMLIRASPDSLASKTNSGNTPVMCAKASKSPNAKDLVGILERFAEESFARSGDNTSSKLHQ